jgi:predicted nuclease with TOPRIM domain
MESRASHHAMPSEDAVSDVRSNTEARVGREERLEIQRVQGEHLAGLRTSVRSASTDAVPQDFERLEQVVRELSRRHTLLRAETEALRAQLETRDGRISELESELVDSQSRRESAVERLDTLIAELDRLDQRFEAGLEGRDWDSPAETAGAASEQVGG